MSEANPFAGLGSHGRQVEVFLRGTSQLNPAVDKMLRASKTPLIVMSCGNARLGKSTLLNQFINGPQDGCDISEYAQPFEVGDETTHVTNGVNVAPPIKLRDLLAAHNSLDLLARSRNLSGDEDVFVVDVEGLDSPDGASTCSLFSQLISVAMCCTCCLYVSRGAPSVKEIQNVLNLLRLCKMDISNPTSSHRSRMAMCMLPKDVILCTTRDTAEAVRVKHAKAQQTVLGSLDKYDASRKLNVPELVETRELTVECFPQMFQVSSNATASRTYWSCFRDILDVICFQVSHHRLESGQMVADAIQQTALNIPNVKDFNCLADISTVRLTLLSAKILELMKRSSDLMWDECKKMDSKQLENVSRVLVQEPDKTVHERFAKLDECKVVDSILNDWPNKWKEIVSSHALELSKIVKDITEIKDSGMSEVEKLRKEQEARHRADMERCEKIVQELRDQIEVLYSGRADQNTQLQKIRMFTETIQTVAPPVVKAITKYLLK